jgi:hypothetical protein
MTKDVWMLEVVLNGLKIGSAQRLVFTSQRRMNAAYRKVVKAMADYEARANDRPDLIEIKSDDDGVLTCKPRDIISCRSVNVAKFEAMNETSPKAEAAK